MIEIPAAERPAARRWTLARRAEFLRALERTLSVTEAARSVGMSRQSAYKLRRRLAGQPFAHEWDKAIDCLRLADSATAPVGPLRCPVCGAPSLRPAAPV